MQSSNQRPFNQRICLPVENPRNFHGLCTVPGCCRSNIVPGGTHCFVHAGRHGHDTEREDGCWRDSHTFLLLIPPARPLAPWLSDPSLLPKRPPVRVHQEISQ